MTANEFLKQLEEELSGLQKDERENAMAYYREYFLEAGSENESTAAEQLGSPQSVAHKIINEIGGADSPVVSAKAAHSSDEKESPDAWRIIMTTVMMIVTFPFWITIFSLWFALVVTIAAILIAFAFSLVGGPIQGIVKIAAGAVYSGIYDIGAGLLLGGIAMLLWKPAFIFIKAITVGSWNLVSSFINGMLGRRKNK